MSADKSAMAWVGDEPSRVWIARGDGEKARALIDPKRARADGEAFHNIILEEDFSGLRFSPDASRVYFLAHGRVAGDGPGQYLGGATSLSLFSVEIRTGKIRYLINANGFSVIDACKDASLLGSLAVYVHSYDVLPSSAYDWLILVDSRGKRIGDIDQQVNLDRLLAKRCGIGKAPPDPPPVDAETLRKARASCPSSTIEYKPRQLLDGTTLDIFVMSGHGEYPSAAVGVKWLRDLCP